MKEEALLTILEQILLAVDFMHKRGIIHRDLKLDNILINRICQETDDIEVVISDLGVAKNFIPSQEQPFLFHQCGTPSFIAPEILRGEGYTTKADIFSVGCLFFNILTG